MKKLIIIVLLLFASLCFAQIYISEVSDADVSFNNEFLELYNNGSSSINLDGYKLVRVEAGTNTSDYVFDIGTDESDTNSDYLIPARGFLLIARGNEKTSFETEWGILAGNVNYNSGNSNLYFGASTNQYRWRLRANDGSPNMDDGTLIDDTGQAVGGAGNRHYQLSIGGPWILDSPTNATPGSFDSDQALPVELTNFTAAAGDGRVTLRWVTASEVNNVQFDILRALEREGNYIYIGSKEGQFNTNQETEYRFTDFYVSNGVTYWYKIVDVDVNGVRTEHGPRSATPLASGVEVVTLTSEVPEKFVLYPGYPNPFNPSINLTYDLPRQSEGAQTALLEVYNTLGKKVRTLFSGILEAGSHAVTWNGTSDSGRTVPGGVYYALLRTGHFRQAVKMTYLR